MYIYIKICVILIVKELLNHRNMIFKSHTTLLKLEEYQNIVEL